MVSHGSFPGSWEAGWRDREAGVDVLDSHVAKDAVRARGGWAGGVAGTLAGRFIGRLAILCFQHKLPKLCTVSSSLQSRRSEAATLQLLQYFEVVVGVAERLEEAVAAALNVLRAQVRLSVESCLPYGARFAQLAWDV